MYFSICYLQLVIQNPVTYCFCYPRIHAVAVCDNAQYFYDHVDQTLDTLGMGEKVKSTDILDVVDGYKGKGYGLTTDEDLGTY